MMTGLAESARHQTQYSLGGYQNSWQLTKSMAQHLRQNAIQQGVPSEKLETALGVFTTSAPAIIDKGGQRLLTELSSTPGSLNSHQPIIERHATQIRHELSRMMMSHAREIKQLNPPNMMSQQPVNPNLVSTPPSHIIFKRQRGRGSVSRPSFRKSETWQRNKPALIFLGQIFGIMGTFILAMGLFYLITYLIQLASSSGR
jgi:hypothetical protein